MRIEGAFREMHEMPPNLPFSRLPLDLKAESRYPVGKTSDAANSGCRNSARRALMAATIRARTVALACSPCTARAVVVIEVWLLRASSAWLR